jgi:ATP-binding cassette subfamily B protein
MSEHLWPADRLGELLGLFAERLGTSAPGAAPPSGPPGDVGRWMEAAAARLGLEAEPVEVRYEETEAFLAGAAPAILPVGDGYAALCRGGPTVVLLAPDGSLVKRPAAELLDGLRRALDAGAAPAAERILVGMKAGASRRARARTALLGALLAGKSVAGGWLLRPAFSAGLASVREAGLLGPAVRWLAASAAEQVTWSAAWGLLGWLSLSGRLELGWLIAWLLLLAGLVPLRLLSTGQAGRLAIRAGALVKRRLLQGALRLHPDEVRAEGAGKMLGRVLESEAFESALLTGGLAGVASVVALAIALGLMLAAGGALLILAFIGWVGLTVFVVWRYVARRQEWTDQRLAMTDTLIERMVGHETRLAQEPRDRWNAGDDDALRRHLRLSGRLDRGQARLLALLPRGWFVAGLLALAPALLAGDADALALGLAGVLLALRGFRGLGESLEQLAAAWIAWRRIRDLWRAAARPDEPGCSAPPAGGDGPVVQVVEATFGYRPGAAVLSEANFAVGAGERVLLLGASGGGKSTLARLLAGLASPTSGLVLLRGLDRASVGLDAWRRRVVLAPQFHDNHVLMGTFAFNLLLGRTWPPGPSDLEEASAVCEALELGPLLRRMPSGLSQQVGETGWQLSHGERSRLFLARALLQGAEVVILDESFGALDPQTLRRTLEAVLRRPVALVVVAHP